MDRLQLYINISYDGFDQITSINADEAVHQHVCDLTGAIENMSYDPEQKNIFYLLKYTDQGCFIVVLRTIPDRMIDHLAAWIFVPYNITISDERIMEVVECVKAKVLNAQVTQKDLDELNTLFAETYDVDRMAGAVVGNQGEAHAHRFYGGDTDCQLIDLIGSKRYQTSYVPFADVILADKSAVTRVSGPNLTHTPLYQMVKIYPPRLSDGPYRPVIFGQPFNRPYLAPLMGTVEIVWVSDTQVDIHRSVMIGQANMRIDDINTDNAASEATNQDQSKAEDVNLQSTPADRGEDVPRSQSTPDCTPYVQGEDAPRSQSTPGHTPADRGEDAPHSQSTPRDTVHVQRPTQHNDNTEHRNSSHRYYKFEIPASSAAISGMIEFDVRTHTELTGSPIDGYVCDQPIDGNRINYLRYAPTASRQAQLIWGGIGAIAGVLLTLLCVWIFSDGSDAGAQASSNDSITVEGQGAQGIEPGTPPQNGGEGTQEQNIDHSLVGAVTYLDTNKKWTRSELESYPDLKGLYDDMNQFKHERLYGYWAEKLKESRTFAKIAEHARKGKNKKPYVQGRTTFNKPNDQTIMVRTYLNTIDH